MSGCVSAGDGGRGSVFQGAGRSAGTISEGRWIGASGCSGCKRSTCEGCTRFARPRGSKRRWPEPPVEADLVYRFDDSLEGFLTCVFQAFAQKRNPARVIPQHGSQAGILDQVVDIQTDEDLAQRVRDGIVRQLGSSTFDDVGRVFLSEDPERCTVIYRFLRAGFEKGPTVRDDLANDAVQRFARLSVRVANEAENIRQFLRFREVEGGVFYARINPNACVVPLVMGHFAARLGRRPFVIHDEVHGLAGLWDGRTWVLRSTQGLVPPPPTCSETEFADLWRTFYHAIGIQPRRNEHLRRQLMPQRFWRNLTEFEPMSHERDGAA